MLEDKLTRNMENTNYHQYNIPAKGTTDWHMPLNDNFKKLDINVPIRDVESNLNDYSPRVGTKFESTDKGSIYYGDGTNWILASRTLASVRTKKLDGDVYASEFEGETLSDKVENAINSLNSRRGLVIVGPREDGQDWVWSGLNVDPQQYRGVRIHFRRGIRIEYPNDGYAIDVTPSDTDQNQHRTFSLTGSEAEFYATGNPDGFVIGGDFERFTSTVSSRGFRNSDGNSTAITVRNHLLFTEDFKIGGTHKKCDIGVDFQPASVTGGPGTESYVDGNFDRLTINAHNIGIRFRGAHRGNNYREFVIFVDSDNTTGILLDGFMTNCTFTGVRVDDTKGLSNCTAIRTGDGYTGGVMIFGLRINNVDNHIIRSEPHHDVFLMEDIDNQAGWGIRNIGQGGFVVIRDGGIKTIDKDGNVLFHVDGNGNIREVGNWQTGASQLFLDGIKHRELGSDPGRIGSGTPIELDNGEMTTYMSNGSSDVTGDAGDVVAAVNHNGSIKTKVLMDFSQQ